MDEANMERQGRIHPSLLDFMPFMWQEYYDLKKKFRKLEKKYYGFLGVRHGRKKLEAISGGDMETIEDLKVSLAILNNYCTQRKKPYLNERVYALEFKIYDFIQNYRMQEKVKS